MSTNLSILYEPNASVMKAGCWSELEQAFGVPSLAPNSHLYLSDRLIPAFPGRAFEVQQVLSLSREDSHLLSALGQANIATRNFPLSPDQLRRRLRLRDGGDTYLFATSDDRNRHIVFVCHRLPHPDLVNA